MKSSATESQAFQGFANRSTWSVILTINNIAKMNLAYHALALETNFRITTTLARELCELLFPSGLTPENEFLLFANWQEVADSMNED